MNSGGSQKVWVITGTSAGLGREIALAALSRGDRVIGSARSNDKLLDIQTDYPENFSFLQLDITDTFQEISAKAKQAVAIWGHVDVLVNNAGYSLIGTVEESRADGFLEMYRTNVFGSVNVTNAFLPYMRAGRNGTVVFIGSRSGWRTNFQTNALYGSSKAALHAIGDALSEELRPFNIKVLNVVPGGLRTTNIDHVQFIAKAVHSVEKDVSEEVPEYVEIRLRMQQYLEKVNGTQTGDPKKAASVIIDVVKGEGVAQGKEWTGTLFLGGDAVRDVKVKCENILKSLEDWGDVAKSIDFD